MMRALRLHIKQAFWNRLSICFFFSMFVLILIYHYYYVIQYIGDVPDNTITTAYKWIGFRDNEMDVYFLLMPVIASLPFSTSYNSDKADGFKVFISKEISIFPYLYTKYIVTFFSGGILYTFPFLFSLLLCKLTIPNGIPNLSSEIISNNGMFASIYFDSPIAYIFIYIGINFMFAGLMAVLGLAASILYKRDYMAILFPFVVSSLPYVILNTIFPTIGGAPIHLYDPKQPLEGISPYVLIVQCILFGFISLFMYVKGAQRDKKIYMRRLQKRARCKNSIQKSIHL
ncbi:hypothetical protein [Bacillus sp. C1]